VPPQRLESEIGDDTGAAVAAAGAPDRPDLRIGEKRVEVVKTLAIGAGEIGVTPAEVPAENRTEAAGLEIGEAALERIAPDRPPGGRDADAIALRERRRENLQRRLRAEAPRKV